MESRAGRAADRRGTVLLVPDAVRAGPPVQADAQVAVLQEGGGAGHLVVRGILHRPVRARGHRQHRGRGDGHRLRRSRGRILDVDHRTDWLGYGFRRINLSTTL